MPVVGLVDKWTCQIWLATNPVNWGLSSLPFHTIVEFTRIAPLRPGYHWSS